MAIPGLKSPNKAVSHLLQFPKVTAIKFDGLESLRRVFQWISKGPCLAREGEDPPKTFILEVFLGSFIRVLIKTPPLNMLEIRSWKPKPPQNIFHEAGST